MKVLLINGSPHGKGNTATALDEMVKIFEAEGVETEMIHVGNKDVRAAVSPVIPAMRKENVSLMTL